MLFSLLAWLLLLEYLVNEYFCRVKRQTWNLLNVLHSKILILPEKYVDRNLIGKKLGMEKVLLIY